MNGIETINAQNERVAQNAEAQQILRAHGDNTTEVVGAGQATQDNPAPQPGITAGPVGGSDFATEGVHVPHRNDLFTFGYGRFIAVGYTNARGQAHLSTNYADAHKLGPCILVEPDALETVISRAEDAGLVF